MKMRWVAGFAAAALLTTVSLAGADEANDQSFRQGLSAMNGGDFATALQIWLPLAERGDPRSESSVGFMYHRGLGVPADDKKAAYWLRRAAEQGEAEGQYLLGTLYFFGYGVPQSYIRSFAWCDMAQDSGVTDASDCRNSALQSMPTNDDMQAAFRLSIKLRDRYGAHH